jgi:RNA polymerase sigma-70 factor (ECF subfamily)
MATEFDEPLVQRAQSGCHEAFGELVRQHHRVVRAMLARYLRDDNEIDELSQRVFVSAFRSLSKFRGESSFASWLVAIARHQAAMYIRGEVRRRQRETSAAEIAMAAWTNELTRDADEPADKLEALTECLDRLPQTSRDVVQKFYFERAAIDSIAQQQGRSAGAIRMMLMRIRQALANCVSNRLAASEEMR